MAEYAINLNNGKTDEKGIFRLLGKLFNQSGVIESTALVVAAQSSPDMTVKVSGSAASDNAVFLTTNADCYHGWNTFSYNVTILANSTGVAHFDAIVAYVDTSAGSATANNPGGLKFIAVRSTAIDGTTKTSAADITASPVGTKPYIRLADVTVGNGVSSINSGNVVDARVFAAVGTGLVAGSSLATSAITLGYTQRTTNFETTSATPVDAGLSVTVTVPAGGRRVKITVKSPSIYGDTAGKYSVMKVWDGPIGSGTIIAESAFNPQSITTAIAEVPNTAMAVVTPAAGSKTYNVSMEISSTGGKAGITAFSTIPAFILVEAI